MVEILKRTIFVAAMCCGAFAQTATVAEHSTAQTAMVTSLADVSSGRIAAKPAAGVPDQYVVGQSDTLHITVWKEPELSQTVVVRPDGNISLPLVKDVAVAGLSPSAVEQLLTERLKAFITTPQVTVTVQEIRSLKAYITGEVAKPGPYPLLSPTSVLDVIAQAGGFTPFAKRNKVFILRTEGGHQTRLKFDYSSVIHGHRPEENVQLRSGDTVVVP